MSPAFPRYLDCLDELRRVRESLAEAEPEILGDAEEPILERMDDIWPGMTKEEQKDARLQSWRAWPDEYARRTALPRDRPVWRKGHSALPPREIVGAH